MKIKLTKSEQEAMIREIKSFHLDERDEEIGDLAAMLILDFITDSLGKFYYNAGVRDAKSYIFEKLEEISELEIY